MTENIEQLSHSRIKIITCLALSYLFFQTMSLSFVAEWTGLSEGFFNILENIGLSVFLLTLVFLVFLARRAYSIGSSAKAELFDELVKHNANAAMLFGYKSLFLLSVIIFILCQGFVDFGFKVTAEDVARIMITACLVLPYLRFAYLEARNA